jgi:hypothetical protein
MQISNRASNLTNPITGTGQQTFTKVYETSTLGNSILSDSGGYFKRFEVRSNSLQVLRQMGF